MAALRKADSRSAKTPPKLTKAEQDFFKAIENPKPAPEYLKEMFRLYGRGTKEV